MAIIKNDDCKHWLPGIGKPLCIIENCEACAFKIGAGIGTLHIIKIEYFRKIRDKLLAASSIVKYISSGGKRIEYRSFIAREINQVLHFKTL